MAVRSLNPLEQHAGKIFLAVAVIICLLLVMHYVTGNPVKVESAGQTLTVEQVRKQLDDHNARLADKIKPAKYDEAGRLVNPDVHISDPIAPAKGTDQFNPDERPDISRQVLANTGMPVPGMGGGGPEQGPPGMITLPVNLLAALDRPKVLVDQVLAGEEEISHGSVCSTIPGQVWQAFTDNIRQQAKAKNRQIPDGLPLIVYRVRLQRRLVDAGDQPIGPVEDVAEYKDPSMDKTISQWEKDIPFPGPDNVAKLTDYIARWVGPPPTGQEAVLNWLTRHQEAIIHPNLPNMPPGQGPKVDGFVRPSVVVDPTAVPAGGVVPPPPPPPPPPVIGEDGQPVFQPVVQADVVIYGLDTTVKPASRYQYRIRYELFNPLMCRHVVDDSKGNYTAALPAVDWSPWSQTVQTPLDTYIWLRSLGVDNEPQIEVERKIKGKWLKASFTARIGQPVGQERDGVDFRTGLVVVDVRRDVDLLIRAVGGDGKVTIIMTKDTQVVLRDAAGRLLLRSMQRDNEEARRIKH